MFLVPEAGALLLFAYFVLGVPIRGSLLLLIAVSLLGALAFSGLGLLTAARPRTIEGVSGLMNLVMVPMWVFSGVFFASENFPEAMQPFIALLPLTALNQALRGVMIDGSGVMSLLPQIGILATWMLVSFTAALRLFRWR
jgi:ABC-type multidrug transport system permease subunit